MNKKVYAFVFMAALMGCGGAATDPAEKETEEIETSVTLTDIQLQNAGIVTDTISIKPMSTILQLNGKIDVPPQNLVSISVPLGGYLKNTILLPGMHVNKGQVIAVMEDQQYIQLQQDYLTAKANIIYLQAEYNRQQQLNKEQASSDKVYQQAEATYRSQEILIRSLEQKLQLAGINSNKLTQNNISRSINIVSPIDGFVSAVNVNIGKYVSPTEVLFELINPADIHLNLRVFEKDLAGLYIGQPLIAYSNNDPQNKHAADILLIGKNISADGYTEVHCHFDNYDKALVPGTFMNADIELTNKRAFVLPEDAIVRFENKHYIFTKAGKNRFSMTMVKPGVTHDGYTEISNATEMASQQIVVKGAYSLLMVLKNGGEEE